MIIRYRYKILMCSLYALEITRSASSAMPTLFANQLGSFLNKNADLTRVLSPKIKSLQSHFLIFSAQVRKASGHRDRSPSMDVIRKAGDAFSLRNHWWWKVMIHQWLGITIHSSLVASYMPAIFSTSRNTSKLHPCIIPFESNILTLQPSLTSISASMLSLCSDYPPCLAQMGLHQGMQRCT